MSVWLYKLLLEHAKLLMVYAALDHILGEEVNVQ